MKPIFSIRYVTGRAVPATVEFEEIDGRVKVWDFGDGKFGYYDSADQNKIQHTYLKSGEFKVSARDTTGDLSDILTITILPTPTPPTPLPIPQTSVWERFIAWIKKLFGVK
jgi:PKD repeat protein